MEGESSIGGGTIALHLLGQGEVMLVQVVGHSDLTDVVGRSGVIDCDGAVVVYSEGLLALVQNVALRSLGLHQSVIAGAEGGRSGSAVSAGGQGLHYFIAVLDVEHCTGKGLAALAGLFHGEFAGMEDIGEGGKSLADHISVLVLDHSGIGGDADLLGLGPDIGAGLNDGGVLSDLHSVLLVGINHCVVVALDFPEVEGLCLVVPIGKVQISHIGEGGDALVVAHGSADRLGSRFIGIQAEGIALAVVKGVTKRVLYGLLQADRPVTDLIAGIEAAQNELAVGGNAAAVGIAGVAGDQHLVRNLSQQLVTRIGKGGQASLAALAGYLDGLSAGGGNFFLLCIFVGGIVAHPVGAAAAQHNAQNGGGVGAVIVVAAIGPIDGIEALIAILQVGMARALGSVVKDGYAIAQHHGHIGVGTAGDAAAQAQSGVLGDKAVNNLQDTSVLDINATAAPATLTLLVQVRAADLMVVGESSAANFAEFAAYVKTAALAVFGFVAGKGAAGHGECGGVGAVFMAIVDGIIGAIPKENAATSCIRDIVRDGAAGHFHAALGVDTAATVVVLNPGGVLFLIMAIFLAAGVAGDGAVGHGDRGAVLGGDSTAVAPGFAMLNDTAVDVEGGAGFHVDGTATATDFAVFNRAAIQIDGAALGENDAAVTAGGLVVALPQGATVQGKSAAVQNDQGGALGVVDTGA